MQKKPPPSQKVENVNSKLKLTLLPMVEERVNVPGGNLTDFSHILNFHDHTLLSCVIVMPLKLYISGIGLPVL